MLHIFTYGAGNISRFEYLKASSDICNLPINFVTQSVWNGFFDKVKNTLNVIKNLPDTDIVAFVDGFDVLAVGGQDEIQRKFHESDCEILFGAELNCWPGEYLARFPTTDSGTSGYKYLNSGGFIGYKRAVMDLYTWKSLEQIAYICKTCGGDQGYFMEYFLANWGQKNMKLDSNCTIFQNMFSLDWNEIYIQDGRVVNSVMGTTPCFLHFNGDSWRIKGGGDIMPVFVEKLQLSQDNLGTVFDFSDFEQNFNHEYFKRNQRLSERIAICVLTVKPHPIWMRFLSSFSAYDVFMVCDNNEENFVQKWGSEFPKIKFIQIQNSGNFKNMSSAIAPQLIVGAWDKAIYYFSSMNLEYDAVWFIEDDVYFHNEKTLLNLDAKYTGDLLTNEITPKSDDMKSTWYWHWGLIDIKVPEPHFRAMVCACRVSRRLLKYVANYAGTHGTLFYLETLFPTLAAHHKLTHVVPKEMNTVVYRKEWNSEDINTNNLYHPMKELYSHADNRLVERFC